MPIQTPICDFGQKAHDFKLKSTDNKIISLDDVKGENGTLVIPSAKFFCCFEDKLKFEFVTV